jgi:A/G-specific adenine glycosylase
MCTSIVSRPRVTSHSTAMQKTCALRRTILRSWKQCRRDFPWRHTRDPYKIMVAEFMLQRTRAEQVAPIYVDFIKKYPNIEKLSKARISSVSTFINHLGLRNRSAKFVNAAKYVISQFKGVFPKERQLLLEIPGVGDYVAGAIMTVSYGAQEYVVDSNIARFINRCYGLNLIGELRRKKQIIDIAKQLFNYPNTRDLLFALLDFISFYCQPSKPDHKKCSLNNVCNLKEKK